MAMQRRSLTVIRYASFTTLPWKNGGGLTHEAIQVPAVGDHFLWRVSVAEIARSGPFSNFAGYRRHMVLLRGNGITLSFEREARQELRQPGDLIEFDGATPAQCDLIKGPCADLNLMLTQEARAEVRVQNLSRDVELGAMPAAAAMDPTLLIFPIDAPIVVRGANEDDGDDTVDLAPWDLAVASHWKGRLSRPLNSSAPSRVFLATIYP